jgi:hypothetical protein
MDWLLPMERNFTFFILLYLAVISRFKQPLLTYLCSSSPGPKVTLNTLLRIYFPRWARLSVTPLITTKVEDQRFALPPHFLFRFQSLPFTDLPFCLNAHSSTHYRDSILAEKVVFSTKVEAALKKYNNVQLDGKPMKIEVIGINIEAPASAIFSFA